jgi:hypothetical protein
MTRLDNDASSKERKLDPDGEKLAFGESIDETQRE